MDFSKLFSEFGLIGIIIGTLFFILWRMLVWVMSFIKDITKQQTEERAGWLCRLEKISDITNKIADNISEHDKRADERGRYVREEHKQMIETLARINGYKT